MHAPASQDLQVRMFVAVARANSLREAADILGVTQPAVSKQIRALEASLGRTLFLRHGRGMQLTPDGRGLFLELEPLINALDTALVRSSLQSQQGGTLRIATVQTLVASFISMLSRELFDVYPNLSLTIHCDSSTNVVESIERDRADIGFVYETAVDGPDLVSQPLFEETLALYTRVDDEADEPLNLVALKLIVPPRAYALRRIVERALGAPVQPYIECDSLELSLRLVSITDGVTVLPSTLPRDMVEDRGLRRQLLPSMPARRLVALSRSGHRASPAFDAALEIARRIGTRAITPG